MSSLAKGFIFNRFVFINTHAHTSQAGELSAMHNADTANDRDDAGPVGLVLLNLIKATEGS